MADQDNGGKDSCSDDGFEVLDPEPETEEDKSLSAAGQPNPGTIIFCHMEEEFDDIRKVTCQYIRPENWVEQPEDEIAIFEVGWITILEAVARLPADLNIPKGFPLGSVSLKDFSFSKTDYAELLGAVSYFQFCYLRNGAVLGAGTPFAIRGIKAIDQIPLLNISCVPTSLSTANATPSPSPSGPAADSAANEESPELGASSEEQGDSSAEPADLSALRNTISNMTNLTKKLQQNAAEEEVPPEGSALSAFELKNCLEDLSSTMQKVAEAWSMVASSDCSSERSVRSETASLDGARSAPVDAEKQQGAEGEQKKYVNEKLLVETLNDARGDHKRAKEKLADAELYILDLKRRLKDNEARYNDGLLKLRKAKDKMLYERKRSMDAEAELKNVRNEFAERIIKFDEAEMELTQRGLKWISAESDLKCAQQKLQQEEARRRSADNELKGLFDDLVKEKERNKKMESELKRFGAQLAERTNKYEHAKKEIANLRKRTVEEETRSGEALFELKVIKDELHRRESSFNDARKELEKTKDAHAHAEAKQYDLLAEARKAKIESQGKIDAILEDQQVIWRQAERVQSEAMAYKAQLDKTLFELKNAEEEIKRLTVQCNELEKSRDVVLGDNARLQEAVVASEETRKKQESRDSAAEVKKDIMVKELLEKSNELDIRSQQLQALKTHLSQVSAERTSIQNELTALQERLRDRKRPSCDRPCCAEGAGSSSPPPSDLMGSVFQALDEAHEEIQKLKNLLEAEKDRAAGLDQKLQLGVEKQRVLLMEKLAMEAQLKELSY